MTTPTNDFLTVLDGPRRPPPSTTAATVAEPSAYGRAALAGEVAKMLAVPIGSGRNAALNTAAFRLGQLVAAGALDERTVTETLGEADGGLDYPATAATIASGLAAGQEHARLIEHRPRQGKSDDPLGYAAAPVLTVVQPAPAEPGASSPSSWAPLDLGPYLDGTTGKVAADLMRRSDGVYLLYPGKVHSFHGESESGKSLLLQLLAAELIGDSERVLFVDFESDPASLIDRLRAFGAEDNSIREWFHYVQPEVRPDASPQDHTAWAAMLSDRYRLAIIDGVTDALSVFGYATKENDDVTAWMRTVPKLIADRTGAAVVIIDHVTKDAESRGRFAIGGQAKMNGLTGAAYVVSIAEPLGLGMRGAIVLRIGKDRPGNVRAHGGPFRLSDRTQEIARVVVDSTGPATSWEIQPWQAPGAAGRASFRPTTLMERVSRFVELNPEASGRNITEGVSGNEHHIRDAIALLVDEEHLSVSDGPHRSKLHTLARSYRAALDPKSDVYTGGRTQPVEHVADVA